MHAVFVRVRLGLGGQGSSHQTLSRRRTQKRVAVSSATQKGSHHGDEREDDSAPCAPDPGLKGAFCSVGNGDMSSSRQQTTGVNKGWTQPCDNSIQGPDAAATHPYDGRRIPDRIIRPLCAALSGPLNNDCSVDCAPKHSSSISTRQCMDERSGQDTATCREHLNRRAAGSGLEGSALRKAVSAVSDAARRYSSGCTMRRLCASKIEPAASQNMVQPETRHLPYSAAPSCVDASRQCAAPHEAACRHGALVFAHL